MIMSTKPPEHERRQHPRFDLVAQVHVKRSRVDVLAELVNVSISGAFLDFGSLRLPAWLKPDRVVDIEIVHPVDLDTIGVQGKVVRVARSETGNGVGVQFVDLTEEAQADLQRLIEAAKAGSFDTPAPAGTRS